MKRINCILIFLLLLLGNGLYAQTDSIISVSGEVGDFDSGLDFLNEAGATTRFPRLTDAGELLYYAPVVSTDSVPVATIGSTTATVYGNILFNGWCESVLEQGFQISMASDFSSATTFQVIPVNPYTDCDLPCSENVFSYSFTGLTPSTTYYVRAYATNSEGTGYGNILLLSTPFDCGVNIVQDYDGNTYNTVLIGSQCWMKENLRTTRYSDGTPISQGSYGISTTTAHWYYPNGSSSNKTTYGLLYNWKALMRNSSSSSGNPSGVQGICPTGWHVPSDAEWKQLEMFVGMSQSDANSTGYRGNIAARLSGNTGWRSSNTANSPGNLSASGRNSSGFTALPAGSYYTASNYGNPQSFSGVATFWTATESSDYACRRLLDYDHGGVLRNSYKISNNGYSVRCVKD